MENLVNKFRTDVENFLTEAQSQIDKGNKAAGVRARKASLDLEKALKEFRRKSLDSAKK
jgi:hypothetical protein